MASNLKPWYHVVDPREDLLENRPLDASEFAVHLDHIRRGNAHPDYLQPDKFFERTYLTESLQFLASQVLRRLSGIHVETSAVFNMSTQFGGGKSHSLAALYHLAHSGDQAHRWKGVEDLLRQAELARAPQAAVAVLMGKEFDSVTGRGGGDEPLRKTPWGEIAWQLGGERSFNVVREHEATFTEPKGDVIREMLPKDRPSLILMDELISYVSSYRDRGYGNKLYNFLDVLCETARGEKNVVVVVSVPASDLEYTKDDAADEARFRKMLDRLGKAILMSADKEISEIIRRRLFQWHGLNEEGKRTVRAYADWASEHAQEIAGVDPENAYRVFEAAYPFHPNLLSVFERKWAGLPHFQKTRGVLRLLALWVAELHRSSRTTTGEPLIGLGSAPFDNANFRSALFSQLGNDRLETPVTTDILGKSDAHALRLDKEADPEIKKQQLHRKVATVIFFESNGGQSQSRAEATLPEIKAGIGGPDVNLVNTDTVLESLANNCFYLNLDRNRYRFGLAPNLNQVLVDRQGSVKEKDVFERLHHEIQTLFDKDKRGSDAYKEVDRKFFPARSNDIPSRHVLTLVVLGPEHQHDQAKTHELMKSIVSMCGASGRTFKSALIFAAPDALDQVFSAARELLAWEDIDDDAETKSRFDEAQQGQLKKNLDAAKRKFSEAVFRAYRHVYLLDRTNELKHLDLGQITTSSAGSIVECIFRELERTDFVTTGVSAAKLVRHWPGTLEGWSTLAVRDAFYSSPQLPRLLRVDAIRRTIADGVASGELGYATKTPAGGYKLQKPQETLFEHDVEISEDLYILQAATALKLKEPPRLKTLVLNRLDATLAPGEKAAFSCAGRDQYGQAAVIDAVSWSATGGAIDTDGVFTAGADIGQFMVRAEANGLDPAIAEVRVRPAITSSGGALPGQAPGKLPIRWEGEVPPQKWMNFYTKVLTRFASNPDLKLRVSFHVHVEEGQYAAKESETRAGLKELGLRDELSDG